jgi:arylsulfatase A-like enzyme
VSFEKRRWLLAALGGVLLTGCGAPAPEQDAAGEQPPVVGLLRAEETFLGGEVAGEPWDPAVAEPAILRLDDVAYRALPAEPPSRLRFELAVPVGARLHFASGLGAGSPPDSGVDFAVQVMAGGSTSTVWTGSRDSPQGKYGQWVPAEVDLSPWAGQTVELTLETTGRGDHPARVGWGAPAVTGPDEGAPLIILYVVDTLRADHTGPYGYPRDTTPALDELARDGVVFEQMVAQSSWTKPSMASVMTSLLPAHHEAVRRLEYLSPDHATLAEELQQSGWSTGAVLANAVLYAARAGFDQGFEYFAGLHGRKVRRSRQVPAAAVVDAALDWLETRRGEPTFLWVHTMDPHFPYDPPSPFDRRFASDPVPEERVPPGLSPAKAREWRGWIDQYDGEIAYGDQELGRFLGELETRGLYDRALILFLSDHGEEFLDHGGLRHGFTLFEEVVRVPLLVKLPGGGHAGRRVARQVQTIDVMPTILRAAGAAAPGAAAGRALQDVLDGDAPPVPAFIETQHWEATALGVRTETEKYIRHFGPEDQELLFDLVRDPGERTNRAAGGAEQVRAHRTRIGGMMRTTPFRTVVRATGESHYEISLETSGWLEDVEVSGLGPEDSQLLEPGAQRLRLELQPRPGASREVSFRVRPAGAPVRLSGSRDGRGLQPGDITWAGDRKAKALPFLLPDPERENPLRQADRLFLAPGPEADGLDVWLVEVSADKALDLDEDTLEALRAMGYVEN